LWNLTLFLRLELPKFRRITVYRQGPADQEKDKAITPLCTAGKFKPSDKDLTNQKLESLAIPLMQLRLRKKPKHQTFSKNSLFITT
jgi:hypothetical protein